MVLKGNEVLITIYGISVHRLPNPVEWKTKTVRIWGYQLSDDNNCTMFVNIYLFLKKMLAYI